MLRRVLTIAGYVGAGIFIIGATIILVAFGKGYSYDFAHRHFVLNGLVILESSPDRAAITIDGKPIRPSTPYRSTIEAGDYNFEVSKTGFRPWSKRLSIIPSEVTFARYILLIRNDIKTDQVKLSQPAVAPVTSPNRKRVAYLSTGPDGGVWVFDVGSKKAKKVYAPRVATATAPAENLTSVAWSEDDNRLLVGSTLAEAHFSIINANGTGEPIDLTDLFNQQFTQLKFDPSDPNQMYWISPQGNLHRLNLADRTASAVLAQGVSAFAFGGGRVFYVQSTPLGQSMFSLDRSSRKQELIQSLAQSTSYQILYSRYNDRDQLVVIPAQSATATLYQNIFDPHPTTVVIAQNVDKLSRSPSGRFIAAHDGSDIVTYDLEKNLRYDFKAGFSHIQDESWFDDFHLLVMQAGHPNLIEYDGFNRTELPGTFDEISASPSRNEIIGFTAAKATYETIK